MSNRQKDRKMLKALLLCEEIEEDEREAFNDMYDRVESHRVDELTSRQRAWVEKVYFRHNLDREEPAKNLVSSGKVKVTQKERESLQKFLDSLGPRPLKPPGRF
jgi:hypothetical protein